VTFPYVLGKGAIYEPSLDAIAQVRAAARERGDVPVFFTTMAVSVAEVREYLPKGSVEEAAE
jgi:hypothetical protein